MEEKKKCCTCKEWKELSEFGKHKSKKDGLYPQCKKCRKENYKNNIINIKEYYQNNKTSKKITREKNKISKSKYDKKYREINKKSLNIKSKIYYKNNKENIIEINKKYNNSFVLWKSFFPKKIEKYEKIRQNGEFLEVKCAYCGSWFIPRNSEIKHRLNAINGIITGDHRLYCSNKCKKECPIFNKNKWPKEYKPATSREVQPELRQLVLLRDNYTCQICEKYKDELKVGLHCHHYEGILWNPIESADIDACITLCKTCHKKVHKLPGCGYNDMKCKNR